MIFALTMESFITSVIYFLDQLATFNDLFMEKWVRQRTSDLRHRYQVVETSGQS